MAIDVFLPTVVRQAITIDKSGSNVSGTLIPQNDPSGEENRGVKDQPSPTALFSGSSGSENARFQNIGVQKPTPPKLATPPFADYLAQEQKQQALSPQALSPLTIQQMPPMISDFLNDIATKYGVEAPSQQQLQSALKMTSDYRPPKPVVVETKIAINKPTIDKPVMDSPKTQKLEEPKQEVSKTEIPPQTNSEYSASFGNLSETAQKGALDYGRMLEALNRYSVNIQDNH